MGKVGWSKRVWASISWIIVALPFFFKENSSSTSILTQSTSSYIFHELADDRSFEPISVYCGLGLLLRSAVCATHNPCTVIPRGSWTSIVTLQCSWRPLCRHLGHFTVVDWSITSRPVPSWDSRFSSFRSWLTEREAIGSVLSHPSASSWACLSPYQLRC